MIALLLSSIKFHLRVLSPFPSISHLILPLTFLSLLPTHFPPFPSTHFSFLPSFLPSFPSILLLSFHLNFSGAVLCRVSRSFLRFAQLELFGIRQVLYLLYCTVCTFFCVSSHTHLISVYRSDSAMFFTVLSTMMNYRNTMN